MFFHIQVKEEDYVEYAKREFVCERCTVVCLDTDEVRKT